MLSFFEHHKFLKERIGSSDFFFVGGSIRDFLLGIEFEPKDIDLTMAGIPKDIKTSLNLDGCSFFWTEKFGTMTLIPKDNENKVIQGSQYEITPFRTEQGYDDHRHPDEIQRSDSLIADAQRRDFTINCLYLFVNPNAKYDLEDIKLSGTDALEKKGFARNNDKKLLILQDQDLIEKFFLGGKFKSDAFDERTKIQGVNAIEVGIIILDPYKGITDLINGKLNCVGSADRRLSEDSLRIMRALRIVNVLNKRLERSGLSGDLSFDFSTSTRNSLKKNYFRLQRIAKERIKAEIIKVCEKGNLFGFVALLDELNLLKTMFPGLSATKGVEQPIRYHPFDVYAHSMLVLYHFEQICDDPISKLGVLYHDVGKVDQYYAHSLRLTDEERKFIHGSWLNHSIGGADIARRDFTALGFSNDEVKKIGRLIELHMKPGEILMGNKEKIIKKVRKLLSEIGVEECKILFDVAEADRRGQYNMLQGSTISEVNILRDCLEEIFQSEGRFTPKELKTDGNQIMKFFKLEPGPKIGQLLEKAFDRVSNDIANRNNEDQIFDYLKSLPNN